MRIQIAPYQPAWKVRFERLREELSATLKELSPHIEHIGSTSVEGLAAKPIIDVQVGVQSEADFDRVVERMLQQDDLIYYQVFNESMPRRRLFVKLNGSVEQLGFPKVFDQLEGIPHEALNELRIAHIHVWVYGTEDWIRHIAFREYLRAHEDEKAQYQALKIELSQRQ
jgi:GrpB-like predicted nucleotidyltransferase (UPF0157 family)